LYCNSIFCVITKMEIPSSPILEVLLQHENVLTHTLLYTTEGQQFVALSLALVCKYWSQILLSEKANSIWVHLAQIRWPAVNSKSKIRNWYSFYKRRYISVARMSMVGRVGTPIENCDFEFECPLLYEKLTYVEPGKRFCDVCTKHVYEVNTQEDLEYNVAQNHCVSFFASPTEQCTDRTVRLLVVGDRFVGKTTLLRKFQQNEEEGRVILRSKEAWPTMEFSTYVEAARADVYVKVVEANDEYFETTRNKDTTERINLVVYCFSVDDTSTLKHIKKHWMPLVQQIAPRARCVVLGLKTDLRGVGNPITNFFSQISAEAAQKRATKMGARVYLEYNQNTDQSNGLFEVALREFFRVDRSRSMGCVVI